MDGWNPYSYWYPSPYGYDGYNGCAMLFLYNYANGDYLHSPQVDASAFSGEDDKVWVEFDMWWEYDAYNLYYGSDYFYLWADDGYGNWTTLTALQTESDFTFDNSSDFGYYYYPETSPKLWKHYKIELPKSHCTPYMHLIFYGEAPYAAGGNLGIDNVLITGEQPMEIAYTPNMLDFGQLAIGTTSGTQCVTLTNESSVPVQINSAVINGVSASAYSFVGGVPGWIDPLSSVDICLELHPTTGGFQNANLVITNNSDNFPVITINLIGESLAPVIELIPIGVDNSPTRMFKKVRTKLGDTTIQAMVVKNNGKVDLLISNATDISGDYPGSYFLSRLPAGPIGPNMTDTLFIGFTPRQEGLLEAKLNVASNAANGVQVVHLTGVGILPRIVVTPDPMRFDSVQMGTTAVLKFSICNPGSDTLRITKNFLSSADQDFTIVSLTGSETLIAPEKCREVTVTFTPKQMGTRTARFAVQTNIPFTFETPRRDTATNILYFDISGTGVPVGTLRSGDIRANGIKDSSLIGVEKCRTATITNVGDADVTINKAGFEGTAAADYTITGLPLPYVLKAKSSVTVTICGTPTLRGSNLVELTIAGTTNEALSSLKGTVDIKGLLACVTPTPSSVFENVKVAHNVTDSVDITVTNCGDVPTTYTPVITGADEVLYRVAPAVSPVVDPNGTTTFRVYFTPTSSGMKSGTLTFNGTNVTTTVDLGGEGACAVLAPVSVVTAPVTPANGTNQFTVTITNNGNLDWNPGTPVIAPSNAFRFVSGASIPAGQQGTLTFSFDPPSMNTFAALVTFPNAGVCGNALEINVEGSAIAGSVKDIRTADGYVLSQNTPNPVLGGTTSFTYTVPTQSHVRIVLADVSGKIVRELVNTDAPAGTYAVDVETTGLASGTYLYMFEAGTAHLARQLVIAK